MDRGLPDDYAVRTAVALATRAPSVHNSQPWRWYQGDESLHLYADPARQLAQTDPDGRDLMLSCGAALHHLRVAFAALGWRTEVHRFPNDADPDHLAAIKLHRRDPGRRDIELAAAIPKRRTDRRRYSSWAVPPGHVELIADRVRDEGAVLRVATDPQARFGLEHAIAEAARRHEADPAYQTELAAWSGRHISSDGVPAANTPAPGAPPGEIGARAFTDPELAQPAGAQRDDDEAILLVLGTASDDRLSRLRAGEATSVVMLTTTCLGLANCPLTEPLEIEDTRDMVRAQVLRDGGFPQMALRVGWAHINADPLPATARRDLGEVLAPLSERKTTTQLRYQSY